MLDLRLLETFREVAARGSFSAAAEALAFTQPAVSQHIARLEKQLGTRLFDRDARRVTPTRAGATLLRHAETLLEAARRAEADTRAAAGLHVPEVHIGSFATAASGLVPMALQELRSSHPALRPRLSIVEDDPALDELAAGRLDLALLIGSDLDPAPVRAGITAEVVLDDPMLVALPAGHPLAHRAVVELEELRDEPWLLTCVGGTCSDTNIVLRACSEAGFEPNIEFESEEYNALLGLTSSGMGIALIPSLAAPSAPRDVVVRPIAGDGPKRSISAATRQGNDDPNVEAALDALRIAGRRLSLGIAPATAA